MSIPSFYEPKMFDLNGGELEVAADGDLQRDLTLETLVYLSFYTGSSDVDTLKKDKSLDEFEEATNAKITAKNLKIIENKASNALAWLVDEQYAKKITVEAISEKVEWVKIIVNIETDQELEVYTFEKSKDRYKFPSNFVRAYEQLTGKYATYNGQYAVGLAKN